MKKIKVLVIGILMLLVATIMVQGQTTEDPDYDFRCVYDIMPNKFEVEDMVVEALFDKNQAKSCPQDLIIPFVSQTDKQRTWWNERSQQYDLECSYVPVDNYKYRLDTKNIGGIRLIFDSNKYFKCPNINFEFKHNNLVRITSIPKIWEEISPEDKAKYNIVTENIPLSKVSFDTEKEIGDESVYGVSLAVTALKERPEVKNLPPPELKVYQYLTINKENFKDEDVQKVNIEFYVDKDWIEDNEADASGISMYRYSNGAWNDLRAYKLREEQEKVFYEAVSPGFSYFLIAAKPVNISYDEPDDPERFEVLQGYAAVKKVEPQNRIGYILWSLAVIGIVILAVIAFYTIYRGSKKR